MACFRFLVRLPLSQSKLSVSGTKSRNQAVAKSSGMNFTKIVYYNIAILYIWFYVVIGYLLTLNQNLVNRAANAEREIYATRTMAEARQSPFPIGLLCAAIYEKQDSIK